MISIVLKEPYQPSFSGEFQNILNNFSMGDAFVEILWWMHSNGSNCFDFEIKKI